MIKLNLEWQLIDGNRVALIFDKSSWMAFQTTAETRGIETTDMISEAVVKLLGPAVMGPVRD
jgi:hypothetical protein